MKIKLLRWNGTTIFECSDNTIVFCYYRYKISPKNRNFLIDTILVSCFVFVCISYFWISQYRIFSFCLRTIIVDSFSFPFISFTYLMCFINYFFSKELRSFDNIDMSMRFEKICIVHVFISTCCLLQKLC